MNSVGVIGFGRFGKILADILQKGFLIKAYDVVNVSTVPSVKMCELEEVLSEETVFVAVPIRQFKDVINNIMVQQLLLVILMRQTILLVLLWI